MSAPSRAGRRRRIMALGLPYASFSLLAVLTIAGCDAGSGDSPEVGPSIRDSAGIQIVENEIGLWSEPEEVWTVDSVPDLAIGVADGDPDAVFARITGVERLSGGTIVVADAGSSDLRAFDRDGSLLWRAGGSGGGPGEFAYLSGMTLAGDDSLLVFDGRSQRLSVFSGLGEFVRDRSIASELGGIRILGRTTNGDLLFQDQRSLVPAGEPGTMRLPHRIYTLGPSGGVDTLVTVPGFEFEIRLLSNGQPGALEIPFGRAAFGAFNGDRIVVGSNDRFEFRVIDPTGSPLRVVRYADGIRPVSDSEVDALLDRTLAEIEPTPARTRAIESLFRDVPPPELRPAYSALVVDRTGYVWVREWASGFGDSERLATRWTVFTGNGALLGEVQFPEGFTLHDAGVDWVLGNETDAFGVERVVEYWLRR